MQNLTQAFVKRATCQEDKTKEEFYDNDIKGFMLEVRANGVKSYFLRVKGSDGVRRSKKIADANILDLKSAKAKAIKLKQTIEKGKELTIIIKSKKQKPLLSLGEFYTDFYLPHIEKNIKSHKSIISLFKNHILPKFKNIPLDEIKKPQIMKLHADMVEIKKLAPATANKVLIFLSNLYNVAKALEIEGLYENPASKIKPYILNNAKERYLTKQESQRLIKAINSTEQNPHLKYIVPMLILTGARRGEVLKAKHEYFDLTQFTWTIPITKNGKKRVLPLTPQLLSLYMQIPKTDSPYLFPSFLTGKPYVTIYTSWNTARTKAGLKDVRMHDLRHSFASALVNSGRSLYEVQILLGHSNSKMTQRYAHLSNESLMKAASCAANLL